MQYIATLSANLLLFLGIYLAVPLFIRFVLLKRPITRKWVAICILAPLFIVLSIIPNMYRDYKMEQIDNALGLTYKPRTHMLGSPLLYGAMFLSYFVLRRRNKKSDRLTDSVINNNQPEIKTNEEFKKCPFCAEIIKLDAIKCRFCKEMLNGIRKINESNNESQKHAKKDGILKLENTVDTETRKRTIPIESKERIFCIDDACTGVLDKEGYCGECGKDSLGELKYRKNRIQIGATAFCSEQHCIGKIGSSGKCMKCGKSS